MPNLWFDSILCRLALFLLNLVSRHFRQLSRRLVGCPTKRDTSEVLQLLDLWPAPVALTYHPPAALQKMPATGEKGDRRREEPCVRFALWKGEGS